MRRLLAFPLILGSVFLAGCSACRMKGSMECGGEDTSDEDEQGLPDVRGGIVEHADGCQDVKGTTAAGAARYFWGEYRGDATSGWSGQEEAHVIANDKWKETGGEDCVAIWVVTATPSDTTGSCPTCDVGLDVTGVYDLVHSTCPEDMYDDDFTITYALDQSPNGTATWYYAASAETLGAGYWVENVGMNFLSERACAWF